MERNFAKLAVDLFQILIGILETPSSMKIYENETLFQILIGILETRRISSADARPQQRFKSL